MFGIDGVSSFQFRQTKPDEVWLYLTESDAFDERTHAQIKRVAETIRREVGENVRVQTAFVSRIPPTPAGKHRFTISEVAGLRKASEGQG